MTDFTFASFNAHWGVGRFGAFRRERYDVAEVVRGFDADIVVVLESWRDHGGRGVLDDLTEHGYQVESLRFPTLRLSGTMSGYRPRYVYPGEGHWEIAVCSRFPIRARRDLPIGRIPRDAGGARSALLCTLDVCGVDVDVVAVHVSSKIWKLAPVRHLRALRPQLPARGRTVIIAGDFNLWGPGVVAVLPGWKRAVLGRTYPAHRPHSQIDHVLVREDVTVLSGEVLPATPSDHRPIRARLRVAPGPGAAAAGSEPR